MMLTRSCRTEIPPQPQIIRDTTIEVQIDTQYFPKPVPYKVEVRDTVYLSNPQYPQVFVQEIKEYKDSTYYARISGINAYLEEMMVYPKTITQYITNTERVYIQPKKWSVGIQGGIGFTPKGLQPYLGVGVTRRLEL